MAVEPYARQSGYWFGGGNLVRHDGKHYLVGRYRNQGDSRTGLEAGERGMELAVFQSTDHCETFQKVLSLSKLDVSPQDHAVLSIEGTALRWHNDRVELFVSSEKSGVGYPQAFSDYLKPGAGVWSIDRLVADSLEELRDSFRESTVASSNPDTVHVKDPFLYRAGSQDYLGFCSHPISWTCSNTGFVSLSGTDAPTYHAFPRGNVWDVAMSRGTCIIDVPRIGSFVDHEVQLLFYDGGECVRDLQQHAEAVTRPRGYSCEELGGAAYILNGDWRTLRRLSAVEPLFVSPHGSGCSRYVDVMVDEEGMIATWQQAQTDGSQPLVLHRLAMDEIESVLR